MNDELWTTVQAAEVCGVSKATIQLWIRQGIVSVARTGRGRGNHHTLSSQDVLAIALTRDCRSRGLSLAAATNLCSWLIAPDSNQLQAKFDEGYRYLIVVGDEVSPMLHTQGMLPDKSDLLALYLKGIPVAVLDVASASEQLAVKLREFQSEAASKAAEASHDET